MNNPIEDYARSWLDLFLRLANPDAPDPGFEELELVHDRYQVLEKRESEEALEWIQLRLARALRQLLGGAAAPQLAHLERDGLAAVEIDMIAARLVEEHVRRGVVRSADPEWREKANTRMQALVKRAATPPQKRAAARVAPAETQTREIAAPANLEQLVTAAVDKALATRPAPALTFADAYKDVWRPGGFHLRGDIVTFDGSCWLAKADTAAKPGENEDWKLIVKRGQDGRKGR